MSTSPSVWNNVADFKGKLATEHSLELNFVETIILAALEGEFRGKKLKSGPIDPDFFDFILNKHMKNASLQPGQKNPETLWIKRIMYTLGAYNNKANFVIVAEGLNSYKARVSGIGGAYGLQTTNESEIAAMVV